MDKLNLTWDDLYERADVVANEIHNLDFLDRPICLYGIPNGGIPVAVMVQSILIRKGKPARLVERPADADCFVDDIVDSGATRKWFDDSYNLPFFTLIDKPKENLKQWISLPYERMQRVDGPHDNIRRIIEYIGDDPNREGLKDTPDRIVRSYKELFSGYAHTPADVAEMLTTFEDGACDELVLLKNIPFTSFCEHHMLSFTGKAHIAYVPNGKVVGVSKLARVLDAYSRRLQIQERLTQQITSVLDNYLKPLGSACIIEASHACMACRGVMKHDTIMVTSSLTGVFRQENNAARMELLQMIKG